MSNEHQDPENFCIFAHYDRDGVVDPYVYYYLNALRGAGFEIIFVSSSQLQESDLSKLRIMCFDTIIRENVGHDFGSWSVGLQRHKHRIQNRLLLANDSVYGPIFPLDLVISRLVACGGDFYGMVKSMEHVPHIQSWFMLFDAKVVHSSAFERIFCQQPKVAPKEVVISEFELRATQALEAEGFTCSALYDASGCALARNPTSYLWRQLVDVYGIPFLKVGMIRENPSRTMPDSAWQEFLRSRNVDVYGLAIRHAGRFRPVGANNQHKSQISRSAAEFIEHYFVYFDDVFYRRKALGLVRVNLFLYNFCALGFRFLRAAYSCRGWSLCGVVIVVCSRIRGVLFGGSNGDKPG